MEFGKTNIVLKGGKGKAKGGIGNKGRMVLRSRDSFLSKKLTTVYAKVDKKDGFRYLIVKRGNEIVEKTLLPKKGV